MASLVHSNHGTLAELLEEVEEIDTDLVEFPRGLLVWERILNLYQSRSNVYKQFSALLSIAQHHSLHLLREWWNGDLLHDAKINPARSFIYTRSKHRDLITSFPETDRQHFFRRNVESAYYHHHLVELFEVELAGAWRNQPWMTAARMAERLDDARHAAARHAAVQRHAMSFAYPAWYSSVDSSRSSPTTQDARGMTATIEPCPWLAMDKTQGLPYYLWDVDQRRTIRTEELADPSLEYTCISHTWGRWPSPEAPAQIEGVPWLVPCNRVFSVKSLPLRLKEAKLPTRYVWFDLLCIPQDRSKKAQEEIARQAAIFSSAKYCAAWLNTLSGWGGLEAAVRYLSYQYLRCSAWGAGVQLDHETIGTIVPPSAYLDTSSSVLENLAAACQASTGFFSTTLPSLDQSTSRLCAWFTSLWTLQEFCLRPDMILLDTDFHKFVGPTGQLIHLDELIALIKCALQVALPSAFETFANDLLRTTTWINDGIPEDERSRIQSAPPIQKRSSLDSLIFEDWPTGKMDLAALLHRTGLTASLPIAPSVVLELGEKRQCTSRRAEAIMSVFGATNWYEELLHESSGDGSVPELDLVFDKYPLVFLQEAAKKIGATFYGSTFVAPYVPLEELSGIFPPSMAPVGSLLPFNAAGSCFSKRNETGAMTYKAISHESIESWTIRKDGSVYISKAALRASTSWTTTPEPFYAQIFSPVLIPEDASQQTPGMVRAHEWMHEMKPHESDLHLHAVQLCQTANTVFGLLLLELNNEQPRKMLQVGTWLGMILPNITYITQEAVSVDWIVM